MNAATGSGPLHILSIATLFPDASRPNFGIFVQQSLAALARQPAIRLTVVAPVGMPPWPLSLHPRYADLRNLPLQEDWHGITVMRPRFTLWPKIGARRNAAAIARAVLPIARALQQAGALDVIDAQFFHPDGHAAQIVAQALSLPYSVKARGSDISQWSLNPAVNAQLLSAAQGATGLLAVSKALRDDMAAIGMPADKISIHYTGLDSTRFHPIERAAARAEWDLPADAPVLLTVGTLTPRKGQRHVLDAMALLGNDVHYVLAGKGEDRDALAAHAAALGLAERVRFVGNVPNAKLASLYSAADVSLLMSVSEGLANAWVEALACGTPLIISDITPAYEVIDAPDAGRICASEPTAIAAAITEMLSAKVDRAALAERTCQRFNWDRNGAQLAEHLRACVQRFNGRETAAAAVRRPRRPPRHSPR